MTILLTGGTGFLGAWVARRLLAAGHTVRVFDRSADRTMLLSILGDDAAGPPMPIAPELEASVTASVLGPLPHTSLRDGLARTIEFQGVRHSMGRTA